MKYKNLLRREQVIEVPDGKGFKVYRAPFSGYFEFSDEEVKAPEVQAAIKNGNIYLVPTKFIPKKEVK